MNKDSVMAMIRKKSAESGVSINTLLLMYFFERFLIRAASSSYKTDLILKGGFLLSSLVGIETRTTMDMDMSLRNRSLSKENVDSMFKDILSVKADDEVTFELRSIQDIKVGEIYPGVRVSVVGRLANVRQPFSIDIATGDPITPAAVEYHYNSVFPSEKEIAVLSYNLETIIAEKLETVVSRKTDNSRSKDFYDLHLIWNLKREDVDHEQLISAIDNTFRYRGASFDIPSLLEEIEDIRSDPGFRKRWELFCRRNEYVEDLDFDTMIDELSDIIKHI